MKFPGSIGELHPEHVASYMDAWIEIDACGERLGKRIESHPTWMRGLKYMLINPTNETFLRRSYMDAWIEI
ncbi:hypothetical protein PB1_10584 [Bacillus methanolicus PB1]|uniref:Uncharacterized protein n=1 Tax=Bacillus methanolicus PB1 TaxID=997296 RepID=I3DUT6_BACMT|nr:hypothetical protein PB1_10584 [Bacillus methanolicus PB1]